MTQPDVVIVSDGNDGEARLIESGLRKSGLSTHYFDPGVACDASIPDGIEFSDNGLFGRLSLAGQICEKVGTVLFRRLGRRLGPPPPAGVDEKYIAQEHDAFLANLLVMLEASADRCVNGLYEGKRADNKAYQLRVAALSKLPYPPTLMSNDLNAINCFRQTYGSVIIKGYVPYAWTENGQSFSVRTTALPSDYSIDWPDVQIAPCIYQKRILKKRDIRVLVLGHKLFAISIEAGELLDWRPSTYSQALNVEPISLPFSLINKIHDFMKRLGLLTGSLDFCLDENDNFFFLEINEMGQSLFLEELCPSLPILKEWVRFLVPHAKLSQTAELSLAHI